MQQRPDEHPPELKTNEARQAENRGNMLKVVLISALGGALLLFATLLFFF